MEGTGYLHKCRYLLHDRDRKFCCAFRNTLEAGGGEVCGTAGEESEFESLRRALGTFVKEECLSRLILFGENSLRRVISNYLDHFHHERNHQGKGNLLLFPTGVIASPTQMTAVRCGERLGGWLKYYYSRAA
jgi:hypothetical protein